MAMEIKRTNSENSDFKKLVKELDVDLEVYYKEKKTFYDALNAIEKIKYVVLVYNQKGDPIGCGGVKEFSQTEAEIKRMYVPLAYRKKGIATIVLNELEKWSTEMKFQKCILETLKEKSYAIGFYEKNKYKRIPNFGEYAKAENSICFAKELN